MSRRSFFLALILATVVLSVAFVRSPLVSAAAQKPVPQTHQGQKVSPAVSNCFGPIVLTIVYNGGNSTLCWYREGYTGLNPNLPNVTYVHADPEANTNGWFRIYIGGVGYYINFFAGQTKLFDSSTFPNKMTQICLVCSPHS